MFKQLYQAVLDRR